MCPPAIAPALAIAGTMAASTAAQAVMANQERQKAKGAQNAANEQLRLEQEKAEAEKKRIGPAPTIIDMTDTAARRRNAFRSGILSTMRSGSGTPALVSQPTAFGGQKTLLGQ